MFRDPDQPGGEPPKCSHTFCERVPEVTLSFEGFASQYNGTYCTPCANVIAPLARALQALEKFGSMF